MAYERINYQQAIAILSMFARLYGRCYPSERPPIALRCISCSSNVNRKRCSQDSGERRVDDGEMPTGPLSTFLKTTGTRISCQSSSMCFWLLTASDVRVLRWSDRAFGRTGRWPEKAFTLRWKKKKCAASPVVQTTKRADQAVLTRTVGIGTRAPAP